MKLIKKLLVGRAAAAIAGKEVKKAKKKVKKTAKRAGRTALLGLLCFCAGAGCMGYFAYAHRNVIAAAVNGTPMPKSPHRFFCSMIPGKKK